MKGANSILALRTMKLLIGLLSQDVNKAEIMKKKGI